MESIRNLLNNEIIKASKILYTVATRTLKCESFIS